jgi:hypothetical protein
MGDKPLTIQDVGSIFGLDLPKPGLGRRSRSKCPFKKHARRNQFRVWRSRATGQEICFCWSCSDGDTKKKDAVMDSVALYAKLAGVDRVSAWKRLRDDGFSVPGLKEGEGGGGSDSEDGDRQAYAKVQKKTAHAIAIEGERPAKVLPLDLARWQRWRDRPNEGVLEAFAKERGMTAAFLRAHGVVEMGGPYVGFTYVNPMTDLPCRVKVRGTKEKKFWVEPRPDKEDTSGARALDVLYMANELELVAPRNPLILVEGELDALALRYTGILNVISLPDGAGSALTADLSPIHGRFLIWFLATDHDEAGQQATATILSGRSWGMMVLPVVWKRPLGDDFEVFKDANAALLGGFRREDFLRCMQVAAKEKGLQIDWRVVEEEWPSGQQEMRVTEGSVLEGFEGVI